MKRKFIYLIYQILSLQQISIDNIICKILIIENGVLSWIKQMSCA